MRSALPVALILSGLLIPAIISAETSEPIQLQPPESKSDENDKTKQEEKTESTQRKDEESESIEIKIIEVKDAKPLDEGAFEKSTDRRQTIDKESVERRNTSDLSDLLNFETGGIGIDAGAGGTNKTTIIDGLPPGQITVLRDGLPMRRANGTRRGPVTDLSSIPISPDRIKRIDVYRGLGPTGTGTEGGIVINIITDKSSDKTRVSLRGLSGQQLDNIWKQTASGSAALSLGENWSLQANGQYRRENAVDVNGDGTYDLPKIRGWSAELQASRSSKKNEYLTIRSSVASHKVDALGDSDAPLYTRTQNLTLRSALLGQWRLDERLQLEHKTDIGWTDHEFSKMVRASGFKRLKSDTEQLEATQQVVGTYFLDNHDLAIEINGSGQRVTRTGESGDLPTRHRGQFTAAIDETWYITDPLKFSARLVGDYHSSFGIDGLAEIGSRYELSDNFAIRASASRTRRVPTVEELYLFFDHSEIGYQIDGNEDLKPERLHSGRAGFTWRSSDKKFGVEAGGFYHHISSLIEPVQAERDSNNAGTQLFTYANIGKAHTAGLNASLRAKKLLWGLNLKANYSYLPLSERLPSGTALNLRANHSGRFEISRHWLDESLETWADIEGRSKMNVPPNSPGAPAYASFGIGAEYQFMKEPEATIQLDGDNFFDQTNATWGPKPGQAIFARLSINYSAN